MKTAKLKSKKRVFFFLRFPFVLCFQKEEEEKMRGCDNSFTNQRLLILISFFVTFRFSADFHFISKN